MNAPSFTRLYAGIELSKNTWRFAFSNGSKIRQITVGAGNIARMGEEISKAKAKLGYAEKAELCTCYEAGRDGFWIHRMLTEIGIENFVIDPASIEMPRKRRRKKTDRIDAEKLVRLLIRHCEHAEEDVCSIVRVPSEHDEDERRLGRELKRLKKEQTAHVARMRSLYALHSWERLPSPLKCNLAKLRNWEDKPLPSALVAELKREQLRLELVHEQILELNRQKRRRIKSPVTASDQVVQRLYRLTSIGEVAAWDIAKELLAWRTFGNRKEVGGAVGLGGTPHDSGESTREQGITKDGNGRIRAVLVQVAWQWIRYNPDSPITQWFRENYCHASRRHRRIGIVAVARKIMVRLWRYTAFDEAPLGVEIASEIKF